MGAAMMQPQPGGDGGAVWVPSAFWTYTGRVHHDAIGKLSLVLECAARADSVALRRADVTESARQGEDGALVRVYVGGDGPTTTETWCLLGMSADSVTQWWENGDARGLLREVEAAEMAAGLPSVLANRRGVRFINIGTQAAPVFSSAANVAGFSPAGGRQELTRVSLRKPIGGAEVAVVDMPADEFAEMMGLQPVVKP